MINRFETETCETCAEKKSGAIRFTKAAIAACFIIKTNKGKVVLPLQPAWQFNPLSGWQNILWQERQSGNRFALFVRQTLFAQTVYPFNLRTSKINHWIQSSLGSFGFQVLSASLKRLESL